MSRWDAREEAGWALDLDELAALLTPRTRLIVVILPHNPTGYIMPAGDFAELLRLAEERGITVVSDEIYAGLAVDPAAELAPAATLSPRAVSLGGLSKSFGLPGLRVGWIATADRALLDRARRVRMHANSFASAPSEYLAAIALRHSAAILARNRGDRARQPCRRRGVHRRPPRPAGVARAVRRRARLPAAAWTRDRR